MNEENINKNQSQQNLILEHSLKLRLSFYSGVRQTLTILQNC